ncbi:MAG: rod shape-determining protein MreC [Bacteriovorax sp.]|nr:rod shape-determining protein MreC [Bacteriovorax sp.]
MINSVILAIALYGMSQRDYVFQKTSIAERVIIDLMAPVQSFTTGIQEGISSYVEHYVANLNASKENKTLKNKIADLQNEVFSYQEAVKESDRLRELINYGDQLERKKIVARVVSWDSADDYKVVRINKGAKNGIKLQSVVTSAEGLVGYVWRLTDHFADVITILDANNRVDGVVERLRSHGVVEGYSRGRCIMKYVNRIEPIILNDTVLTAGLGNVYPKGLKIGYISRIERESYGITQHVEITPLVNFSKLEEVLVLVQEQEEHKQLEWRALDEQQSNPTEVNR